MIVSFGGGESQLTGPVIDGYVIRQGFVAHGLALKAVHVLLSTYKRRNKGSISASIVDRNNETMCHAAVATPDLSDNKYQEFRFNVQLTPGKEYEFRMRTTHCRSGMAPTAHHSFSSRTGCFLFVAGKLSRHRELVCKFEYGSLPTHAGIENHMAKSDGRIMKFLSQEQALSIIILTKNGYDLITKCVDAVLNSSYEPIEIIIGDTGTTDERVLAYYETLPEHVRVMGGNEYHFSKTNNMLAKEASGTHLLFLNNDVFLDKDAIYVMMDYARLYTVGAVGLRLIKPRGVIEHDGQILINDGILVVPDHLNVNCPPDQKSAVDGTTDGVTAACMLTPKSLFMDAGGFDEDYRDIYQDCDYCMRLRNNGFSCVTVRSQSAVHVGSATRGTTQKETTKDDRKRYLDRWKGFVDSTPKMSFITCCNKPEVYAGMLSSLPERMSDIMELVPVQNADNRFTVTESLNMAKIVARGDYLAYCHQDVIFKQQWVLMVLSAIANIPGKKGIIGFEGLANGGTPYACKAVRKGGRVQVQTLDELCIITERSSLCFDEGFKFHYYGADICLQAEEAGLQNWLIGVSIEHLSGGDVNIRSDPEGFKREAQNFRDKWPDKDVWTTTTKFLDGGIYFMILADELNDGVK